MAEVVKQPCKPNFVPVETGAVIHLGRALPPGSSDLPGNVAPDGCSGRAVPPFPYLVLHHEEFAWPRLSPDAPVSSYLTVSPITFRLVCSLLHLSSDVFHTRPDVIRLAALRCSDFPPPGNDPRRRLLRLLHRLGSKSLTNSVEH